MTRILAFSDLHCNAKVAQAVVTAAEGADLVIGAGDFAQARAGLAEIMARLTPMDAKAIHVPGNAESLDELRAATGAGVLHGEITRMVGLRLLGIGLRIPSPGISEWASCDLAEEDAAALLAPRSTGSRSA